MSRLMIKASLQNRKQKQKGFDTAQYENKKKLYSYRHVDKTNPTTYNAPA
jgi:hypothetical protein